ncbi:SEC-C domain-containing protein [Archangium sp.]|uniref:HEAT repeat domain-containing protein n=1 Tax=Archangium sp. TaxID=1872627 RepID=UPI00286C8DEE|nr:SEC-C domain-containing protein [Archangium sp.]
MRRLLQHGRELPPSLRSDILSRGSEVVAPLIALLADPSLDDVDAVGEGYAPLHAAQLLGELRAPEAIGPLLEALSRTEPGYLLYEDVRCALEGLGSAVVPQAFALLARTEEPGYREDLLCVLAHSGVKEERIFEALCEQLRTGDGVPAAANLAEYGDPRAIEPLTQALSTLELEPPDRPFANQLVIELAGAIEELGGSLEPLQQARLALVKKQREKSRLERLLRALSAARPIKRQERPGRNDPCWCGSGVKYKKCHLSADRG